MSTVTLVMAGHEFIVSGAGLRVEVVELAGKRVIHPNTPETAEGSPHHLVPTRGDDAAMASSQDEGATGRQPVDTLRAGRTGSGTVTAGETAPHSESEPLAPPAGDREAGGEILPAPGHPLIGSADSAVSDGEPGTPTEDEERADPGRDADRNRESSGAVTNLKPGKPLRPHCQRPTLCGGYGDKHCGTCLKQAGIAA